PRTRPWLASGLYHQGSTIQGRGQALRRDEAMTQLGVAPVAGELDPAERMSVDELQALQLDRLRWTLRYAYANVPFYRNRFDAAGVSPQDCRSLDDLASFPVTTKGDLRENYPAGLFAVPVSELRRIHASSGTTGQPTVGGYTQADLDTWSDLMD